jgi:hypothetical protein
MGRGRSVTARGGLPGGAKVKGGRGCQAPRDAFSVGKEV